MALRTILTRERLELVGDALVVTAGGFAVVVGLSTILVAPTGEPRAGMQWATAIASLVAMATAIALPIFVWLLHGRRLSWQAVLGGVVGAASAGPVLMAVAALSTVLGVLISPFSDSEYAGPAAMLVILALAFAAVALWRLVDAIRDLRSGSPEHRGLDLLRIAAVVALVGITSVTAWWVTGHPGDEGGEAPIYMMLFGLSGAMAVAGAEVLSSLASGGPRRTPPVTAGGADPTGVGS
jgi:hypothetical protein